MMMLFGQVVRRQLALGAAWPSRRHVAQLASAGSGAARAAGASLVGASLIFALLAAGATTALAQATSTVSGTVRDEQGLAVPGATITLINQAQDTRSAPAVTSGTGAFVIPNVAAGVYAVQVEMPSFRTLRRENVTVSPGSQVPLGTLTLTVGGQTEVVTVSSEAPLIQAASGERSFTIDTETVTNLPLMRRTYDGLLTLAPGVQTNNGLRFAERLGGGGGDNFMLDGATAMDPGINRPAMRVSVEAISEVKVATSGYQAEYGRSAGLQVNAVTKSGSNRFHGSLYDVERNDAWNANDKENILNGDPKETSEERDWGFAIGGPIGRPGGDNKLFFYFNYEANPRTRGADLITHRLPTVLERMGDFSQSTDQRGRSIGPIVDFRTGEPFPGNVIPADRLYQPGLAILNWWPEPNIPNVPDGQNWNWERVRPDMSLLGYQPLIRLDYVPTTNLRGTFKFVQYLQPNKVHEGSIPGFNDSKQHDYGIWIPSATINYTMNPTTFIEGTWGGNFHHQEGCSISGGQPNFCFNALPVNPSASRLNNGAMADLPYLFPDATRLDPDTWSYFILNDVGTSVWDGERVQTPPEFGWGNKVGPDPPDTAGPFGNFILDTRTRNLNVSLTKVQGRHTLKTGYYYWYSRQRRGSGAVLGEINFGNDSNNPLDTGFGFSNAALGVFSSYEQLSRWGEGDYTSINHEAFIQDNWKMTDTVTLDYGVRFVHQKPTFDGYMKNSTFLADRWDASQAPVLYEWGCAGGEIPCSGGNRQALNPITEQLLGPGTSAAVGTLVPGTGNPLNGVFAAGQGVPKATYDHPNVVIAPRFGAAWDLSGDQSFIVRGGAGMFYDRDGANAVYNTVQNPPFTENVEVRYGQLQNLDSSGLRTQAPPSMNVFPVDTPVASSVQWNVGIQSALPFNAAIDVAYTGQHSFNRRGNTPINNIDLGTAYLAELQDPTLALSGVPGQSSLVNSNPNTVRTFQGFGNITQRATEFWQTYHSIQLSINRRFQNGFLFGFSNTIGLYDRQSANLRMEHLADGTPSVRADQPRADELLGNNHPLPNRMRAHFVWDLPDVAYGGGTRNVVAALVNGWNLSGIWTGQSGDAYSVSHDYDRNGSNLNLTGSPNFSARALVVGDPGSGCSSDLRRQFNTNAFQGPGYGSDGLESGNGYLRGCFESSMDVAINRSIPLGGGRSLQLRLDVFNLFNQAGITGRETTFEVSNPNSPSAITNLPFDADGNLIESRSRPRGAGFGVADGFQAPRTLQFQARFQF